MYEKQFDEYLTNNGGANSDKQGYSIIKQFDLGACLVKAFTITVRN